MLGSNDSVQKPDPLHVSIDDYKANLHAIVANLRQRYPAAATLFSAVAHHHSPSLHHSPPLHPLTSTHRYPAATLFLLTPPPCDGEAFKKW